MTEKQISDGMMSLDKWFMDLLNEQHKDPFNTPFVVSRPDYLYDHNATQRVINDMPAYREFERYWREIHEVTRPKGMHVQYNGFELVCKATAMQKCEAILKAYNKWED